jgi:hypothetical protein
MSLTNNQSELVMVARMVEAFFALGDLRCPVSGKLHEYAAELNVRDMAHWHDLMGFGLGLVVTRADAVKQVLPALEREWPEPCAAVRDLLREADREMAAVKRGDPVRPICVAAGAPGETWALGEPADWVVTLGSAGQQDEDDIDDEPTDFATGEYHGRRWVELDKGTATRDGLTRLDKLHRRLEEPAAWGRWLSGDAGGAYSAGERLFFVLAPDHVGDPQQARAFWDAVLSPGAADDLTPLFLEGFVVGALEAWDGM